ncbi:MAG: hypothetical protein MRY75_13745 [Marivita sp.]|uniref:hypothetical protein n=1 Tax=Marivita sp. TaxID=2003365 RepID=UPI0025B96449|nr:hypothetical protein [Marivita sp.]MCI5111610.1 hypothetical protein [Marivita sp.]
MQDYVSPWAPLTRDEVREDYCHEAVYALHCLLTDRQVDLDKIDETLKRYFFEETEELEANGRDILDVALANFSAVMNSGLRPKLKLVK